jgi:hypothetical protein
MEEPPLKRPRIDDVIDKKDDWDPVVPPSGDDLELKYTREVDVGITEFLNRDFEGFDCILKYRLGISYATELRVDTLISLSTKSDWMEKSSY